MSSKEMAPASLLPERPLLRAFLIFSIIFLVLIIIIIVCWILTIGYLVYRPAVLKYGINQLKANLLVDEQLTAEFFLRANATNACKMANITVNHFSVVIYIGSFRIAKASYVGSFTLASHQKWAEQLNVTVTQVPLPLDLKNLLIGLTQGSVTAILDVHTRFHTTTHLPHKLKYSQWVKSKCSFFVERSPPDGVLKRIKCETWV